MGNNMQLIGGMGVVLAGMHWLVYLIGAIMALVLFLRRRNAASALALIGFGLPALTKPILTILQYTVPRQLAIEQAAGSMLAINGIGSIISIGSSICLVVAFWLAMKE